MTHLIFNTAFVTVAYSKNKPQKIRQKKGK